MALSPFFGAVLLPPVIEHINWRIVVYSLLSLSVVRMAPVALSLANMRLQRQTILFLGWFGPRGIASILYCLLVLEEGRLPQRDPMYAVIMFTVLISIFAHGLTAAPLSKRYAAYTQRREDAPDMPEHVPVQEMPLRSGNRTLRE